MSLNRSIPFKIESFDSLGQGVSKVTDKITFIPKTLPGEEGNAELLAQKKGVAFARVINLTQSSPQRTKPECAHYENCPSCHFLHTNYDYEIELKRINLERLFFKLKIPKIEVIKAPKRFAYRNRVQLHYDVRKKLLGMFNARSGQIIPIPNCLIVESEIKPEMDRLYFENQWLKKVPKNSESGHLEIYKTDSGIKINWNKPYAEGGFTQVFQSMNLVLKEVIQNELKNQPNEQILDLFAGNGNISNELSYSSRLCIDIYPEQPTQNEFFSQNIYADDALKNVLKIMTKNSFLASILLLDPPRSGLKNLKEWVEQIKPKRIIYVSCDPHTLVRDIGALNDYQISKVFLLDFFPSTFHFESLVFLERNS